MLVKQLWLFVLSAFLYSHGFLRNDFYVLNFALNGFKSNPTSFATLKEHKPTTPFPDVFTICWRSRTTFARDIHLFDFVEIPSQPGNVLLRLMAEDNGAVSWFSGKFVF